MEDCGRRRARAAARIGGGGRADLHALALARGRAVASALECRARDGLLGPEAWQPVARLSDAIPPRGAAVSSHLKRRERLHGWRLVYLLLLKVLEEVVGVPCTTILLMLE